MFFLPVFQQEALRFHLALDPANYVAALAFAQTFFFSRKPLPFLLSSLPLLSLCQSKSNPDSSKLHLNASSSGAAPILPEMIGCIALSNCELLNRVIWHISP